jgi:hypothetical protein
MFWFRSLHSLLLLGYASVVAFHFRPLPEMKANLHFGAFTLLLVTFYFLVVSWSSHWKRMAFTLILWASLNVWVVHQQAKFLFAATLSRPVTLIICQWFALAYAFGLLVLLTLAWRKQRLPSAPSSSFFWPAKGFPF